MGGPNKTTADIDREQTKRTSESAAKMPHITLKFRDNILGRYLIAKGKSLTIGRRKENDIVIDNLAVSGHHAKIDSVGDAFVLVDLQSKNGSFVNERLVSSHWLKKGDIVSIGKHSHFFDR
jgi:pSer/pThr/pTyr-binding forkhead associated (FHA) protein